MPAQLTAHEEASFEAFAQRLGVYLENREAAAERSFVDFADYEMEAAYAPAGAQLDAPVQTTNHVLVSAVIAALPATATGLLVLGPVVVPLSQPVTVISSIALLLQQVDLRRLTSSVPGPMSLVVMGRQLSPRSLLR